MGSHICAGPLRYAGKCPGSPEELWLVLGEGMGKTIFEFNNTTGDVNVRKPATGDYVLITKGGVLVAKIPVSK
jgi:hypothetical protein